MRRKEKEIQEKSDIEEIIRKAFVCRLAMFDGDQPYIVPLCFGYRDNTLYFHGARKGKKLDIIKKNHKVCFEFDENVELIKAEKPCEWGIKYQSVIGFGKAVILENPDDKQKALEIIMAQYSNKSYSFPDNATEKTALIKVEIENMTGKQSGL